MLDPDAPDPRRILRDCMDRSMATISRLSAASPAEIRAIHERLSERDRSLLAGLYGKTAAVTLGASGVSLFLTSAIGPRTAVSAILGGITAGAVGAATAAAAVATRTPDVLLEAARTGGPSALADEIVCLDAEHRSACSVALERTRTEARSAAFAVLVSPLFPQRHNPSPTITHTAVENRRINTRRSDAVSRDEFAQGRHCVTKEFYIADTAHWARSPRTGARWH